MAKEEREARGREFHPIEADERTRNLLQGTNRRYEEDRNASESEKRSYAELVGEEVGVVPKNKYAQDTTIVRSEEEKVPLEQITKDEILRYAKEQARHMGDTELREAYDSIVRGSGYFIDTLRTSSYMFDLPDWQKNKNKLVFIVALGDKKRKYNYARKMFEQDPQQIIRSKHKRNGTTYKTAEQVYQSVCRELAILEEYAKRAS